jgi:hypothetical protein
VAVDGHVRKDDRVNTMSHSKPNQRLAREMVGKVNMVSSS